MVAGGTGGAGTLACAFFCANGVAAADLFAPLDPLVGALATGLPVLSDVLLSAVASRLPAPSGTAAPGCRAIGLSEVVPLMLKFYRDGAPHAPPRRASAPH